MAAFSKAYARLQEEGIGVVAASTDPLEKARATAEEQSLTFPVGHGLPLRETASRVGEAGWPETERDAARDQVLTGRGDGSMRAGFSNR